MAIKRTREQKQKAHQLRSEVEAVELPSSQDSKTTKGFTYVAKHSAAVSARTKEVFASESASYVIQDLRKTIVTASLLFIALVGIYFYLRYN